MPTGILIEYGDVEMGGAIFVLFLCYYDGGAFKELSNSFRNHMRSDFSSVFSIGLRKSDKNEPSQIRGEISNHLSMYLHSWKVAAFFLSLIVYKGKGQGARRL